MFRLAKLFVVMVSLMMLNCSFAGDAADENGASDKRDYKGYCTDFVSWSVQQLTKSTSITTGLFSVDEHFSEDSTWLGNK